ncbi:MULTISPECIES: hypothetical protein [Pseudomonas]|uniref:Uncharacterized protein n=2 Tax=Pseudomonas mosselii TaxID=78327 RepID=A0ABX9AWB6_9PSED|nr:MULTISPECIES: hypothetical protein [Pseudomonas]MBC3456752.1 hypothetical protein [Pseudomonas mosselii]MBH3326670.1 hypothetical protein [Pseudomonas mosselii]QZP25147.1 hypothetical protein K5H97_20275 [Pseudomonas mosselii]UPF02563.1 hypothetical protein MXB02_18510 [Pseudomonas mosselii]
MEKSAPQVRNAPRPMLVTVAVIYCLLITSKIAYWLVGEGWEMARVGDFAMIMLAPPALSCILLVTSSVLLYRRSAKSVWFLLGALLFGLTLIPLMFPEIFRLPASLYPQAFWYVLPGTLQAMLLVAVWIYSLRMRQNGYLK